MSSLQHPLGLSPYLPNPAQRPPGWQPSWPTGTDNRGDYTQDPNSGTKWYPHEEDPGHWPHYDNNKGGRYPDKCVKPWPNQTKPPYGKQSPTNPWESGDGAKASEAAEATEAAEAAEAEETTGAAEAGDGIIAAIIEWLLSN